MFLGLDLREDIVVRTFMNKQKCPGVRKARRGLRGPF
jgi:hypothetical protein